VTSSGYTNPGVVARKSRQSLRIRITNRVSTVVIYASVAPDNLRVSPVREEVSNIRGTRQGLENFPKGRTQTRCGRSQAGHER